LVKKAKKKIVFNGICSKCGGGVSREKMTIEMGDGIEEGFSTTEKSFCDKCDKKFIKWLKEKDYSKSDCWCQHIEEYVNGLGLRG